jgi:L-fucose isomerase
MNTVFSGDLPKIGIRPTIDGRKGVRETLEAQTMQMAKATDATGRNSYGMPKYCLT